MKLADSHGGRAGSLMATGRPIGADLPHAGAWLTLLVAMAVALRLNNLAGDLWLDEITTAIDSRRASLGELLTTYTFAGRHLLNSLLVRVSTELFGPSEWAIRLPAWLFGVAGVPATYFLARSVFNRREAMLTAGLVATSYHHVFFSLNARGYTGYLFFVTLGTAFLLRALESGRRRDWGLYAAAMWLAGATQLLAAFAAAAHALVVAAAWWKASRDGRGWRTGVRRAAGAGGLVALGWLLVYAPVLPQIAAYTATYEQPGLGFAAFSLEHLREWIRGLAVGFGAGTVVGGLLAAGLALLGSVAVLRWRPLFGLALLLPLVVQASYQLLAGHQISPRFYIWILPAGCLILIAAAALAARRAGESTAVRSRWTVRWTAMAPVLLVGLIAAASLTSLWSRRDVPKQASRASLDWILAHRQAGEPIAAVHLARWGLRFYGPRAGLAEGTDYAIVTSSAELAKLRQSGGRVWVVTTFHRALRLEHGEILAYLEDHFERVREFPATVGDAEVVIWLETQRPQTGAG